MFKPIISIILRLANVNSISPYTRTNSRLLPINRMPNTVIQIAELTVLQNWTITAAAVNSAGNDTMAEYTTFHPCANDSAGSTKCSACRMMAPLRGRRALLIVNTGHGTSYGSWNFSPQLCDGEHNTSDENTHKRVSHPIGFQRNSRGSGLRLTMLQEVLHERWLFLNRGRVPSLQVRGFLKFRGGCSLSQSFLPMQSSGCAFAQDPVFDILDPYSFKLVDH